MTLPTGTISMSQVRDEYGFGNPVSLSAARGKPGAPASGTISMSQLRGLSNLSFTFASSGIFSQSGNSFTASDSRSRGNCNFTITATQNCVWTYSITSGQTGTARQNAYPATGGSSTYWQGNISGATIPNTSNIGASRTVWSVTATYGGQTTTWSVSVGTDGSAN